MKLSWRDIATAVLAIFGGAIVYAKFYDLSWWLISGSWRNAIAVLGITGLVMALVSGFNFLDESVANIVEMLIGLVVAVLAVVAVVVATPAMFYVLAGSLGALWLFDIGRHAWRSVAGETPTSTYGSHAPVH